LTETEDKLLIYR